MDKREQAEGETGETNRQKNICEGQVGLGHRNGILISLKETVEISMV